MVEDPSPAQLSEGRGRGADSPGDIPKRGWLDILWRVKREAEDDAVAFYAAGVSFYLLIALVPALAAIAGIYGLVVDRTTVVDHVAQLRGFLPTEVLSLIETELKTLAASDGKAGWALIFGLAIALWGSSKAIEALTIALNRVYDEDETRGFFKRKLNALSLTAGMAIFLVIILLLLVAAPAAISFAGLGAASDTLISVARWPLLFITVLAALNALYRFAPSRRKPKWRWVAPGSLFAASAWLLICIGLTIYAAKTGGGSKTYGSLAAIILLMSFFYLSSLAVLMGGEINAEAEHQTLRDSTVGRPRPIGERGAYVADTIGKRVPEKKENPEP